MTVWNNYLAIVDACCDAWNRFVSDAERVVSIHRTRMGIGQNLGRLV